MSGDLKAQLELSADASGVETGVQNAKKSLASLGSSAQTAGKAASDGLAKAGDGGDQAATKVDRATGSIIASIQRATAIAQAGGRGTAAYFEAIAAQRGVSADVLKPYLDQLDAVTAKQKVASQAISAGAQPLNEYTMSARATAAALRQVPAQFTDIVTGLQAGQAPLTVLLQQGGQLKDVFGGIGPAAKALGGYVLGLINPFTLAAAATAALAYAFYEGSKQSKAIADSLVLTGNLAGQTESRVNALARSVAASGQVSISSVREMAQALIGTGEIGSKGFEIAAEAATRFGNATGKTTKDVAETFAALNRDVTTGATKLNQSLNFLTAAQLEQIRTLQLNGHEADALGIVYTALNDRLRGLVPNLGLIEKTLTSGANEWKKYWDAALNVGRVDTVDDKLRKAQERLAAANANLAALPPFDIGGKFAARYQAEAIAAAAEVNGVLRERGTEIGAAAASSENTAAEKRGSAALASLRSLLKEGKDISILNEDLATLKTQFDEAARIGKPLTAAQQQLAIETVKKRFINKDALGVDKAALSRDIDALKRASDQLVGIYDNQEKILEAQHAAGSVSDAEYFAKKRDLIIVEATIEDYMLQQRIKRYEAEKLAGKDAIDNEKNIAAAVVERAKQQEKTATQLAVLSTQEVAAANRQKAAFVTLQQSAQDYLDTLNRQQDRDLSGIGQGVQARGLNAGITQIEDRYTSQRRDAENRRRLLESQSDGNGGTLFNEKARQQYDEELRLISVFQDKSIASYVAYYQRLTTLQGDAGLGAKEALQNYFDESQKFGKQTEAVVGKALGGIEDAFVTFATTGKLSFKSLADSIIADIIRIQVRAEIAQTIGGSGGSLAGFIGTLGSIFSGSYDANYSHEGINFGGPRAAGGAVSAGTTYLVGEKGPELLQMGSQAGTVIANSAWASSPVKVIVNAPAGTQVDRQEQRSSSDGPEVEVWLRAAEQRVAKSILSGYGPTATALRGRGINLDGSNPRKR